MKLKKYIKKLKKLYKKHGNLNCVYREGARYEESHFWVIKKEIGDVGNMDDNNNLMRSNVTEPTEICIN